MRTRQLCFLALALLLASCGEAPAAPTAVVAVDTAAPFTAAPPTAAPPTPVPTLPPQAGQVVDVINDVAAHPVPGGAWEPARVEMPIYLGGEVWAREASTARVLVAEQLLRVAPNTVFTCGRPNPATVQINLQEGQLWLNVEGQPPGQTFEIQTPDAVASVRGTRFSVRVSSDGSTVVSTVVGTVTLAVGGDRVSVTTGLESTVPAGGLPTVPVTMTLEEQLRWGNAAGPGLDVVLPAVRTLGWFTLPGYAVVQSLSPDGRLLIVVYKQGDGTVRTLYYDVATSQEVAPPAWLGDTPAASFSCTRFSPDGRQIAFLQSGSSSTQVCFANWPDGPPTCIDGSDDYYSCPSWSPDGQWALFYRSPKGGASVFNLYRVRPDGSELATLTTGEPSKSGPAWSPDGARIAYTAAPNSWQGAIRPAGELWVMDADGGNARRLMENAHPYGRAAWNPEGQSLVVAGWQDGAANGLWLVSLDGSAPTAVPGTAALQPSGAMWSPSLTGWPLLFSASTGPNNDAPALYYVRGDGADPVVLGDLATGPLWTADGRTAALVGMDGTLADMEQLTSTVYVVRTEPGFYP